MLFISLFSLFVTLFTFVLMITLCSVFFDNNVLMIFLQFNKCWSLLWYKHLLNNHFPYIIQAFSLPVLRPKWGTLINISLTLWVFKLYLLCCWAQDLQPLASESADSLQIIFLYLLGSGPLAPPIWECWQFINYISFISHLRVLTVYRLYFLYLWGSGPSAPHIWECWQFINYISFISHLRVLTVYRLYSLYLLGSGPSAPHIWDCWQFIQWLTKLSQCFAVLDRRTWCGMMTQSKILKLMYNKLDLLGFVEHLRSCDLNKYPWRNEQNRIETHWDSFVSMYYFTV